MHSCQFIVAALGVFFLFLGRSTYAGGASPVAAGEDELRLQVEWDKQHERASIVVRADSVGDLATLEVDATRVASITVKQSGKHVPDLTELKRFPSLESLAFWYVPIDDEALPLIGELKTLKALDLTGTLISDKGVADHLSRFTWLEHLNLKATPTSSGSLEFVAKLTNLRSLFLAVGVNTSTLREVFGREGFACLKPLKKLEVLGVSDIADRELLTLAELPALKRIRLPLKAVWPSIDGLYELKRRAPRICITEEVIDQLTGGPRQFDDSGNVVTIEDFPLKDILRLAQVEDLSSVTTLRLFERLSPDVPKLLPGVQRLTIADTTISKETIDIIAKFKALRECHIENCKIEVSPDEFRPLHELGLDKLTGVPGARKQEDE